MNKRYVLGVNSAYHEPSAALLENGNIVATVEEERYNRHKHGKPALINNPDQLPWKSIDFCLSHAGISMKDIHAIGYSFNPIERFTRNAGLDSRAKEGDWGTVSGERIFYDKLMSIPRLVEEKYGFDVNNRWHWISHEASHAASAFYSSPFDEAAVLATDGIGEFSSMMLAHGKGTKLNVLQETSNYPNSLGFLWTKASSFLRLGLVDGMPEYGAGTVMALASYGNPKRFSKTFEKFVRSDEDGRLSVNGDILQFREGSHSEFENIFGFRARKDGEPMGEEHMDFAATLQQITNGVQLGLSRALHKATGAKYLCRAGGVALNCNANAFLLENGPFQDIFVYPGANDMGTAPGAALYLAHMMLGEKTRVPMKTPYLGPEFDDLEIRKALDTSHVQYCKPSQLEHTAAYLLDKGSIVGWFQGRMEFGPRALGNRSLLADPRRRDIIKRLSQDIKGREWFRPLAPVVLEEKVDEWFVRPNGGSSSDLWMLMAYKVKGDKLSKLPGVTHYDDTGRVQTVNSDSNSRLHKLIKEFDKITGVPILVNTSFNVREPIVCTPQQAVQTFIESSSMGKKGIDYLVIGDYLVANKGTDLSLITKLSMPLQIASEHLR